MVRRIPLHWGRRVVGTIEVPENFRPPITQAELNRIPATLFVRSRSWLFEVRPNDVRLELCDDDIIAIAADQMGPGDVGAILGFEPCEGETVCRPDLEHFEHAERFLGEAMKMAGRRKAARQ